MAWSAGPNGTGLQSQSVEIVQRANIMGANTDPVLTNTINLHLSQSQLAN